MSYSGKKGWITKPKPGVRIDPLHPLSRGLVACWLFNEGAGSVLHDISGNKNDGTLTSMDPPTDWVGSPHGGALAFDGNNDYIVVGDPPSLDMGTDDITIAIWLNRLGSTGQQRLYIKRGGVTWYDLYFNANDEVVGSLAVSWPPLGGFNSAPTTITDSSWHHIAVVFDRDGKGHIYIDGLARGTPADISAQGGSLDNAGYVFVGAWGMDAGPPNSQWFNGLIDDVRIYKRALSAQEVKQLYTDPYANLLRVPIRRYWGIAVARIPRPPAAHNTLAIY